MAFSFLMSLRSKPLKIFPLSENDQAPVAPGSPRKSGSPGMLAKEWGFAPNRWRVFFSLQAIGEGILT